jgi:ribosomal protein L24E
MYVYKIGTVKYYCASKCYKNDVVLGRKISSKNVASGVKAKKVEKPAS